MAPRPAVLEEPNFQLSDLGLISRWRRPTNIIGLADPEALFYVRNDYWKAEEIEFLLSDHDISRNELWVPQHVVGKGAFGMAGLWTKSDSEGRAVDELVIKELKQHVDVLGDTAYKVKQEASINRDAQRQARLLLDTDRAKHNSAQSRDHSILHLRNYKYNRLCTTGRLYSIYAPHYTLDDLIHRYRSWDTPLPELFLWHLAHSLAKAAKALSVPLHPSSLAHQNPRYEGKNPYIVHVDIKPDNVFLDYAPLEDEQINAMYEQILDQKANDDDPVNTYPTIRMADFGLSIYASATNEGASEFGGGTKGFMPPEQTEWGSWFGPRDRPTRPEEPWTAKHNIWAIGKLLSDCMTLEDWFHMDDKMGLSVRNFPLATYLSNNRHFLPHPWSSHHGLTYERSIYNLVRDCLSPRPKDRPDPDELVNRTFQGLTRARKQIYKGASAGHESRYRLYYRGIEIQLMPVGNYMFNPNLRDYSIAKRRDTAGTALELPNQKWRYFIDAHVRKPMPPLSPHQVEDVVRREYRDYQANFQELRRKKEDRRKILQAQQQPVNILPPLHSLPTYTQGPLAQPRTAQPRVAPQPISGQPPEPALRPDEQPQASRRGFLSSSGPTKAQMNAEMQGWEMSTRRNNTRQPQPDAQGQLLALQHAQQRIRDQQQGPLAPPPARLAARDAQHQRPNPQAHGADRIRISQLLEKRPVLQRSLGGTATPAGIVHNIRQDDDVRKQADPLAGVPDLERDSDQRVQGAGQAKAQSQPPARRSELSQSPTFEHGSLMPQPQRTRPLAVEQHRLSVLDQAILEGVAVSKSPPVQQSPMQNDALPQASPPPAQTHQVPMSAEYDRMTIEEMRTELRHRNVSLPTNAGRYVKKAQYKRKLMDADQAGKHGNGVWKKQKGAKN